MASTTRDLEEVQTFLSELHAAAERPSSTSDAAGLVEGLSRIVVAADPTFSDPVFAGVCPSFHTHDFGPRPAVVVLRLTLLTACLHYRALLCDRQVQCKAV